MKQHLFDIKGYRIEIWFSRTVKARRLSLADQDDERTVNAKILYVGAADNAAGEVCLPKEDAVYTRLCSPFPYDTPAHVTQGLFRDADDGLWIDNYSFFYLKDPAIRKSGLKIELEIPEILAEKKPTMDILCEGKLTFRTVIEKGGAFRVTIDLSTLETDMLAYMRQVRKVQELLLDEFERVCRKYGLRYFLTCGGLIGTIRDKDLIPWDDDLDVAMTRKDYDILASHAGEEWPEGSGFLWLPPDAYGENVFLDFMTRLVYMKEDIPGDPFKRVGPKGRGDIHGHLPLDIYILENALPEKQHRRQVRKLLRLYALALGHRDEPEERNHMEKRKLILGGAKLVGKIGGKIPLKKLLNEYGKMLEKNASAEGNRFFQSNGYYLCFKDTYLKELFGEGRTVEMGDRMVQVPDKAEIFLEEMYGDFRKLPYIYDRRPIHMQQDGDSSET